MIRLPLTLYFADVAQRPAVAWLVPGDDVASWMRTWTSWQLPMRDWRIVILEGFGALTILPAGQTPPQPQTAWPLGRIGARLYLPITAALLPVVDDGEVETLLNQDIALAVALPGQAILAVTANQVLHVADLLRASLASAEDWNNARAGEVLNDRLYSVLPEAPPAWEQFLNEAGGDIGTQSASLDTLPPSPHEPADGWRARMGRRVRSLAGGLLAWAAQKLGQLFGTKPHAKPAAERQAPAGASGDATGPGAVQRAMQNVAAWAEEKVAHVSEELAKLRHREFERLLSLLKTNPDQGLRYAIPMRDSGHRGRSAPSAQLPQRDPDFNLQSLGGGEAVDLWQVSWEQQQRLRELYHELAQREMRLGRHRRAAYIFAQLLRDFPSAAAALEAGGHWREAAVLYRDWLDQPRAAAECLERGGLLHEAIPIYHELGQHEKVGDLHARLVEPEAAEAAWRRAMDAALRDGDFLDAARIALDKLNSDDEALAVWQQGWPLSQQAGACLQHTFELLGQRGRHSDSCERLEQLLASEPPADKAVLAAEALTAVLPSYLDHDFCRKAADAVRVLAARHLQSAEPREQERLCEALARLAPGDVQLVRDGRNYLAEALRQQALLATRARRAAAEVQLVRTFHLRRDVLWKAAVSQADQFYAAGIVGGRVCLVRCRWTGQMQQARSTAQTKLLPDSAQLTLAADPMGAGPLLLASSSSCSDALLQFAPGGAFSHSHHAVQARPDARVFGVCHALRHVYVVALQQGLVLMSYAVDASARLGAPTRVVTLAEEAEEMETAVALFGRHDVLAVGVGRRLLVFGPRARESADFERELPAEVHTLTGSAPYSHLRLAAGLEQGGAYLAKRGREFAAPQAFAEELHSPCVCFTMTGLLVAVSENGGEIYTTSRGALQLHRRLTPLRVSPVAVIPGPQHSEFALLLSDGTVHVFDVG